MFIPAKIWFLSITRKACISALKYAGILLICVPFVCVLPSICPILLLSVTLPWSCLYTVHIIWNCSITTWHTSHKWLNLLSYSPNGDPGIVFVLWASASIRLAIPNRRLFIWNGKKLTIFSFHVIVIGTFSFKCLFSLTSAVAGAIQNPWHNCFSYICVVMMTYRNKSVLISISSFFQVNNSVSPVTKTVFVSQLLHP